MAERWGANLSTALGSGEAGFDGATVEIESSRGFFNRGPNDSVMWRVGRMDFAA